MKRWIIALIVVACLWALVFYARDKVQEAKGAWCQFYTYVWYCEVNK